MKGLSTALEKLANSFEGFAGELRDLAEGVPQGGVAGDGEMPEEYVQEDDGNVVNLRDEPEDVDDNTVITMKSGDLRRVVDSYRKLSRMAREGKIPTQDERFKLHLNIRAVKHLIRRPQR